MIKKYKKILVLSFIVLSMVGCTKKEKGKAVLIQNNNTTETSLQKEDSKKNALDIIDGKCVVIENTETLYPIIVTFGKDSYTEYTYETSYGQYKVLDIKVEDNIVTYSVENYDQDNILYYDINIEVIDEEYIRYINDNGKSQSYKLISKTEAAIKMKDYEENVENGFNINDKNTDYIIYDSDRRLLTKEELSNYSKEELAYIRNEIFARRGYVFESEEYKSYFNKKTWYTPNPSFDGNIDSLNLIEKENVNLIKELEGK